MVEFKKRETVPYKKEEIIMENKKDYDIRLIGLDLDGTVLTTDKQMTSRTNRVLEACLEQGIEILPATGRAKAAIPDYLRQIKGLRYMILSNGASVYDLKEDKELYSNCIPCERARELVDFLEQFDTYFDFYALGRGWSESRFYDHTDLYGIEPHIEKLVHQSRTRIESLKGWLDEHKAPVEKFNIFFASLEKRKKVYELLLTIPDIVPTNSLVNNLEINYYTCNKGDALINLARILGIRPDQIMACGDGNNDLSMIKAAGLGVAMENGEDCVKEAADFITKTNDEEGVAYAIEKFCLL